MKSDSSATESRSVIGVLGRLLLGGAAIAAGWSPCGAAEVTIRVRCDQTDHEVSPRLIGAFFEDINFAADGGLSAELVKNGSFETPAPLLGWATTNPGVEAQPSRDAPASAANPTFLRLKAAGSPGSVINRGFRGIGVKAGEAYAFSVRARTSAGSETRLRVRLVAEGGELLAEQEVNIAGSEWKPFEFQLSPSATDAKASLELAIGGGDSVDLDNVSLSPVDTWLGRPAGLRKDLVEWLADLKPAFFRFPGGCIVEGSELKYRYQWKTTIGPPDERRLIVNRWRDEFAHRLTPDYYQSFAIGFFEYFQLSEDIGAEPMPIISCGMACQFNSGELAPLDELRPYVQDALDLIEFANGPVDSEWGARRAAMGHPEPFGLKMLGVGNEQWGPDYFDRYQLFAEALGREHPEIELISTSGPFPSGKHFDYAWPLLRSLAVPFVDEHCYAMPDWFLHQARRYDGYDRGGPKVFMGEYAAQSVEICSPMNQNNLRCALAEAAFLTGVERNSDVVTMSAYAPLLAHEEAWQWRPDLIWFDNLSSYATPSYYVQQLFSHHRPDATTPVAVTDNRPAPGPHGRIGLGSFNTSVEFRDLSVTRGDEVLLATDDLGAGSLQLAGGDWSVESGVIKQGQSRGGSRAMLGDDGWGDYTLRVKARKLRGREGFLLFVRGGAGGSRIEWNLGASDNRQHRLIGRLATHVETPHLADEAEGSIEAGCWYDLRVELAGERVRCFLDDKLIHNEIIPNPVIDRVFAAAGVDRATGETILKAVNPTDEATPAQIALVGGPADGADCRVVTLSGDPEGVNSIVSPTNIHPVESVFRASGPGFDYVFPPHSLTVLRIPTAPSE